MSEQVKDEQADTIKPLEIEHSIDEVWHQGQLEQYYNFLEYHFERKGAYIRARAYVDDFRSVAVYGPFEARNSITKADAPDFESAVLTYLERRFLDVSRR